MAGKTVTILEVQELEKMLQGDYAKRVCFEAKVYHGCKERDTEMQWTCGDLIGRCLQLEITLIMLAEWRLILRLTITDRVR